MKHRKRDVLKIQGSDSMRSLFVERELTANGWRVAIAELDGTVLIETLAEQRNSRELFKEYSRKALEMVLA